MYKILLGVNDKLKLYNVYRLCKQNIDFFKESNIKKDNSNNNAYVIENWSEFKKHLIVIARIPVLKNDVITYIQGTPLFEIGISTYMPPITEKAANYLNSKKQIICNKMQTIIDLYESMNLGDNSKGIDIKLPPCEDLKEYISYLRDIEFIFSQCPFLQCDGEILKFDSVDVGSNWIKLAIITTSTCMLLTNTAALVDKAIILRSHYITVQQQEEILKSQQLKNDLTEEQIEIYTKVLKNTYIKETISQLEAELGELADPEERDKVERTLEKLIILLDKGGEIYASLDAPEEIQALFPEIKSNLELPENIIKYLEDKDMKDE